MPRPASIASPGFITIIEQPTMTTWYQANLTYLRLALAWLGQELHTRLPGTGASVLFDPAEGDATAIGARMAAVRSTMAHPPALEQLGTIFNLTTRELDLILLTAGRDLDARFDYLFASLQGNPSMPYPTMRLVWELWPDAPAGMMAPGGTLHRWGMVHADAGATTANRPLFLNERIMHFLTGSRAIDEVLSRHVRPLRATDSVGTIIADLYKGTARSAADTLIHAREQGYRISVQLCGSDIAGKRICARQIAESLGCDAYVLTAVDGMANVSELETIARMWEREARLGTGLLVVDCHAVESPERMARISWLLESITESLIVFARDPLPVEHQMVRLDIETPDLAVRRTLWHDALGAASPELEREIERLLGNFNLGVQETYAISRHVAARAIADPTLEHHQLLWDACRTQARPKLDDLAKRIEPRATWDELVLPDAQMNTIREIAAHVRQRMTVYQQWGVAKSSNRGLGISALFAGASGTGKTMAAEVLAGELRLDLYHIDLSQVVSKYIGETEKNLRRIFDAAEEGGAVLLFDEADALFGKRSEVKDSHDRHANIEVSYLLQRMESYSGLAILTTNMKSALDTAFMRRLRFVVDFPFPGQAQRAEIWRRVYPAMMPTDGLDARKLARLDVAGGNIRNIALNAAFLAADEGSQVQMRHILRAARTEYMKLEKPLTDSEIKDWV